MINFIVDILVSINASSSFSIPMQVFKGLYENASNNIHVNACLAILAAIRDVCKLVVKELTSWVCFTDPPEGIMYLSHYCFIIPLK